MAGEVLDLFDGWIVKLQAAQDQQSNLLSQFQAEFQKELSSRQQSIADADTAGCLPSEPNGGVSFVMPAGAQRGRLSSDQSSSVSQFVVSDYSDMSAQIQTINKTLADLQFKLTTVQSENGNEGEEQNAPLTEEERLQALRHRQSIAISMPAQAMPGPPVPSSPGLVPGVMARAHTMPHVTCDDLRSEVPLPPERSIPMSSIGPDRRTQAARGACMAVDVRSEDQGNGAKTVEPKYLDVDALNRCISSSSLSGSAKRPTSSQEQAEAMVQLPAALKSMFRKTTNLASNALINNKRTAASGESVSATTTSKQTEKGQGQGSSPVLDGR